MAQGKLAIKPKKKTKRQGARVGNASLLEKELKYHLDKENYWKLLRACRQKARRPVRHVNYYFDDPKLRLRKAKYGLRIRIIDNKKAFITLKRPSKIPVKRGFVALKIRHEYETEISFKLAKSLLKGTRHIADLNLMPIRVLKEEFSDGYLEKIGPLGSVRTIRTVVPIRKTFELELDRCKMFEQKFYELEIETSRPEAADKLVRHLFEEHDIPYHPLSKSKLGRFLDIWKKK